MKIRYLSLLLIGLNLITLAGMGQGKSTPPEVSNAFNKKFPAAKSIMWTDKITLFCAYFSVNGEKCEAKFTPDGKWISTEETISWDSLPSSVIDSLKLSKYADWQRASAYILQSDIGATQYHIVVTKNDLGRKILSFNPNGKLLSDH